MERLLWYPPVEFEFAASDMPSLRLVSHFRTTGDQPQAVDRLVEGLRRGHKRQALEVLVGISMAACVPQR